jgi:hypothetical protein
LEIRWLKAGEALRKLEGIPLSFGRGDPALALSLAYQRLRNLKTSKQILILSDLVRGDWEGLDLNKRGPVSEAEVLFLRLGGKGRDPNFCIKEVRLIEGEAVMGTPARLEVVESNRSGKSGTTLTQLYLSGIKVDQKSLELQAGEEGKVYFELFFDKPGWIDAEVRLSGDRLPGDDIFYFALKVREKIKVLIVDGDPRTSLKMSESYYLSQALRPGGLEGSPFLIRVITEPEMASIDLHPYQALFLLNAAKPYSSRLASFLESGKPIFLFLGDRISPEDYNSFTLLPGRIGALRNPDQKPERITQLDRSHEALQALSSGTESLKNASFHRYYKIEGGIKNLLTLGNRDPLLVEAPRGRSRLFLFASSADLDWNDLALKAAYLPLIQGLLKEALGLTGSSLPAGLRMGEAFKEPVRPLQIKGPPGGPGIYRFSLPSGEVRRGINPRYEESDLTKITEEELRKKFGAAAVKVIEYQEGALEDLRTEKKELWPFLLIFLLIILALEMVLANGRFWASEKTK